MKKFIIENDFWAVFPEAKIGIITCKGIDNTPRDQALYEQLLADAETHVPKHVPNENFSENAVIKVWRDAFQQFKTKKGARSSIEALLKRVNNGNHLTPINPLVDIYNAISLTYALPCGGEDIDCFEGDIRLTKALGDEPFVTLGTTENDSPYPGEIVYKDDAGAICRCWNWREAVRTMLTEHTQNAFLCVELVDLNRIDVFHEALEALAANVKTHLGGSVEIKVLDQANPWVEI